MNGRSKRRVAPDKQPGFELSVAAVGLDHRFWCEGGCGQDWAITVSR